jgi:hypothetical protein
MRSFGRSALLVHGSVCEELLECGQCVFVVLYKVSVERTR